MNFRRSNRAIRLRLAFLAVYAACSVCATWSTTFDLSVPMRHVSPDSPQCQKEADSR